MQKVIGKLIIVALISTVGILYYLWQQAVQIPEEYIKASEDKQDSQSLPLLPKQISEQAAVSTQKLTAPIDKAKAGQKVTVKLNDRDLNNLIVSKIATSQPNKQIPVGIKGIRTNIKDGKIHTGALVNLDQLARNGRSGTQIAALSKLTDKLTFLKDRDIYIGIVGKPIVDGTQIKFAPDTQIKVGKMNFTIAQIAEDLGIAPAKIQQAIDLHLQQQNFKVDSINLDNNGMAIEGAKK
ncbi:hypothetical protein [Chamaesiphon sp. VAR_48_metabat_403]|uniref:hypothetical protein n=1 Tax=Chamaesiphon sp. VAR_48_metabat_403 TaxID=2964700 RepID=UPI00286DCA9E|nr:hypothetical protein [Chamaesiphon sp. VAR_48_metabat_403]